MTPRRDSEAHTALAETTTVLVKAKVAVHDLSAAKTAQYQCDGGDGGAWRRTEAEVQAAREAS